MQLRKNYPFGSGTPMDIAEIVVFLASEDSRMLTGITIAAEGGRSSYLKLIAD
jgi:NAD(P)-dependent dehydrogenase (short-subunit alcohol dehydrogenase family)